MPAMRIRRVCGLREIFLKRQYIQYLREKEAEEKLIMEEVKTDKTELILRDDESEWEDFVDETERYQIDRRKRHRLRHIAPGGAVEGKPMKPQAPKPKPFASNNAPRQKGLKANPKPIPKPATSKPPQQRINAFTASRMSPTLGSVFDIRSSVAVQINSTAAGEFNAYHNYIGGGYQRYIKQKFHGAVDLTGEYYGPEVDDRDSEWLGLSDSNDEDKEKEIVSFDKKHEEWYISSTREY
jgi:hypothetical protein